MCAFWQQFLFNKTIEQYLKNKKNLKNIKLPIIGFGFELNSIKNKALQNIIQKILEEEKINPRDFIINQMPELTSDGDFRNLFFEIKDLKIIEISSDDLNKNKQKIKINFSLPKSCYATVALEFFLQ